MKKVKIYVTLKPEVLDPQGKVIMKTLHTLDYKDVSDVRASKLFEVTINSDDEKHICQLSNEICDKVLVNPNIETYRFEIEK